MNSRTRIKICGLTREQDIDDAVEAGADAIGFVLYEKSPRFVDVRRATELARRLPAFVTPVGLFVNADAELIAEATAAMPQLLLQFHGDETPGACQAPGRPYLRAARMDAGFDLLKFALSQFRMRKPSSSMPTSTVTVAVERSSIGRSSLETCPVPSFCLVDCMPQM
jgi:phosphoribosylanthranilate isomerase